jgi:hypothetical protein
MDVRGTAGDRTYIQGRRGRPVHLPEDAGDVLASPDQRQNLSVAFKKGSSAAEWTAELPRVNRVVPAVRPCPAPLPDAFGVGAGSLQGLVTQARLSGEEAQVRTWRRDGRGG